jgi:formylglycine-generating enzyme required for sulfatase activity
MVLASTRDLVETLSRVRLLEPAQLDELTRGLPEHPDDPLALARELLQRGWLTPYQINQIFQDRAGDLVLGHYILLERLGEGGMGQVFKAREQRLGRVVALKILRKEFLIKPDFVRRFHKEVEAAGRLSHPNVVHAYDAEQIGATHVFSMEYVEGVTLSRLVKRSGPLPVAQACEYVRQAALGLQHIHEHGLVHRDIKPANLMHASREDVIKILDLGLVRLLDDNSGGASAANLTRLGMVVGTLDYIAPEQVTNSHQADIRADLYSLGCVFHFLLSGKVPFPGEETVAKLLRHQSEEAVPIEQLRPEVPPRVAAIVRKLMAKQPYERHQTPAELVFDLAALTPPVALAIPKDDNHAAKTDDEGPLSFLPGGAADLSATPAWLRRTRPTKRRSKRWIAAAAVLVAPLLIWLIVHLFSAEQQPAPEENPPEPRPIAAPEKEIRNSLGMKLVRIPAGRFIMGSPPNEAHRRSDEVAHPVTISRPFYLGAHLVTVGNFRAFAKAAGYRTEAEKAGETRPGRCWLKPGWEQGDDYPVACLSWHDAKTFCDWLSKKEGQTYCLPTEAEWEYACRAGSTSAYSFGAEAEKLREYGWHRGSSGEKAHPVGKLKPNAWGLYDMHGNLLQWCGDYYDAHFYEKTASVDPRGPDRGGRRVLRGGSWNSAAQECRSAQRTADEPSEHRNDRGGFRVVLVPDSSSRTEDVRARRAP